MSLLLSLTACCVRPVCDAAAGGCPEPPDAGPNPDAGPPSDAGSDAGYDAGTDAGPDAGSDAGPPSDAGPDAGFDGGSDAGPCWYGGVFYRKGDNNPGDPSQCCNLGLGPDGGGGWVSRLQDAGTYSFGQNSPVTALAIADLNRDGLPDLVVLSVDEMGVDRPLPSVRVMLGRIDGTFAPAVKYSTCISGGVAVGDINGDGWPDVVVGTNGQLAPGFPCGDGTIEVLLNSADGTGSLLPASGEAFQVSVQASSFPLQDFDGDGTADLVLGGQDAYFLEGLVDGGFADPVGFPFPRPSSGDYTIVAGDFAPHDFRSLDFVVGHQSIGIDRPAAVINVFLGDGLGGFAAQPTIWVGSQNLGLAAGDFDGDGHTDIALGGSDVSNPFSILFGNGDGTFSAPGYYPAAGAGLVALADLDQDGPSEALIASAANPYTLGVLWHVGDGGTAFTTIPQDQIPTCVVARDINNDWAPDVAICAGSSVQLYYNACPIPARYQSGTRN